MNRQKYFSWMHPNREIRDSERYGNGVFVTQGKIAKDDVLFVMGGGIVTIEDENRLSGVVADKPIEISEQFSIGPRTATELRRMPQHYANHSCDPNTGFKGQMLMVAMMSIHTGQVVTYDYAMVMHSNAASATYFKMACKWGASTCRQWIAEIDWQRLDLQVRYDSYFQWFLQERILRLKSNGVEQ